MPRATTHHITDPVQLQAIEAPVRWMIISILEKTTEASVREIAEELAVSQSSLYYHFDVLQEAGLIVPCGVAGEGRMASTLYRAAYKSSGIRYDHEDKERLGGLISIVKAGMRAASRDLVAAFASGDIAPRGAHRDTFYFRDAAWLSKHELKELKTHTDAVQRLLESAGPRRSGARRVSCLIAQWPDEAARRRKRGSRS